jgi:hypothetical protein
MAVFDPEVRYTHPLDYRLMQNSFVTMFRDTTVLDGAQGWRLLSENRSDDRQDGGVATQA